MLITVYRSLQSACSCIDAKRDLICQSRVNDTRQARLQNLTLVSNRCHATQSHSVYLWGYVRRSVCLWRMIYGYVYMYMHIHNYMAWRAACLAASGDQLASSWRLQQHVDHRLSLFVPPAANSDSVAFRVTVNRGCGAFQCCCYETSAAFCTVGYCSL